MKTILLYIIFITIQGLLILNNERSKNKSSIWLRPWRRKNYFIFTIRKNSEDEFTSLVPVTRCRDILTCNLYDKDIYGKKQIINRYEKCK